MSVQIVDLRGQRPDRARQTGLAPIEEKRSRASPGAGGLEIHREIARDPARLHCHSPCGHTQCVDQQRAREPQGILGHVQRIGQDKGGNG